MGCCEFEFEEQDGDIVYVRKLLVLDASVSWSLKPPLPSQSEQLLSQLLSRLVRIFGVIEELCDLLVRHNVPDSITGHHNPAWNYVSKFRVVWLRVIGEWADLRLCNNSSFLSKDVTKGAWHSKTWVSLIENPNSGRAELLRWLWRCHSVLTLNCLNHECLRMSIVNLTFVMIQDAVGFVLHVGLVVTRWCHNDDLSGLRCLTASLIHEFLRKIRHAFANHNSSRVASIGKVNDVFLQVSCN